MAANRVSFALALVCACLSFGTARPSDGTRTWSPRDSSHSESGRPDLLTLVTPLEGSPEKQALTCGGNLIITGSVRYAEPGCSDGSVIVSKTQNTSCSYSSISEGPTPTHGTGTSSCVDLPLRRARVELWSGWTFLFATLTDSTGHFLFCLNNDPGNPVDLYVVVVPCPDGSSDGDACGSLSGGVPKPYSVRAGPSTSQVYITDASFSTAYDVCVGSVNWDILERRQNQSGAYHLYNLLANDAFDYLEDEVGWTNNYKVKAVFPSTATEFTSSPLAVRIAAGDQQDPDIVLRTYALFVLYELYEGTFPAFSTDCATHAWGSPSDPACAIIHGATAFLQASIQNDPVLQDTPSPGAPPSLQIDIERPAPAVASAADEGAVAATLWDMFDPPNEGHDAMAVGLLPIWTVISSANPESFCDFLEAYTGTYGTSEALDQILLYHRASCVPCPIFGAGRVKDLSEPAPSAKPQPLNAADDPSLFKVMPWTLTPSAPMSPLDFEGNRFELTVAGGGTYYCLTYKPASGPARMVGKCPWNGGCNDWRLQYIWLIGLGINHPWRWLASEHWSSDFDPLDPTKDCDQHGNVYEDDIPDGKFDWVVHLYQACSDKLTVTYYADSRPNLNAPQVKNQVYQGAAPIGCSLSEFPPPGTGGATVLAAEELDMGSVHTEIVFSGDPAGGVVRLMAGFRSVSVTTLPSDGTADVAAAIALAVNSTPYFGPSGLTASTNGSRLILEGAGKQDIAVISEDPGIVQPGAPLSLSVAEHDSSAVLTWTNATVYDQFQLTKGGCTVARNLPGTSTSYTDSLLAGWPGVYLLIGWKNGMPSAPAVSGPVGVGELSLPGGSGIHLVVRPNPTRDKAVVTWTLRRPGTVKITLHDVQGCCVACPLTDLVARRMAQRRCER